MEMSAPEIFCCVRRRAFITVHFPGRRRPVSLSGRRVPIPNPDVAGFLRETEPPLRFPERFFRPLAVGNVVKAIDRTDNFSLLVGQRPRIDDHVAPGAAALFNDDFEFVWLGMFAL